MAIRSHLRDRLCVRWLEWRGGVCISDDRTCYRPAPTFFAAQTSGNDVSAHCRIGRGSFGAAFAGAAACADATGDGCLGGCACGLYGPTCGPALLGAPAAGAMGQSARQCSIGAWADWTGCT